MQRKKACMNYRECYVWGLDILKNAQVPEAENDARLLLEFVCKTDRNTLLVHGDRIVTCEEYERFSQLIQERAKRIPLQQLTKVQYFYGLSFYVNEHVLIPRQDTEILVEQALKLLKPGERVLDICTGSGCILISLMSQLPKITGYGVDISSEALKVAGVNSSQLLSEDNQPQWLLSDLFDAFCDRNDVPVFDMIVSNPPYIPTKDIEQLMPEVKDNEPISALDGKGDGLYFYRRIVEKAHVFLKENGYILFEIGYDQAEAVGCLLKEAGYEEISVINDYAGLNRVVIGKRKKCLIS